MSKRTPQAVTGSRVLRPRDEWDTPPEAAAPLLQVLPERTRFIEPCAGRGALIDVLAADGHECAFASDIAPRREGIVEMDGEATMFWPAGIATIITNPPYTRQVFLPLLDAWMGAGVESIWMLVPLDWTANRWFAPYTPFVARIVRVGRVRWLEKGSGFENSIWLNLTPGRTHGLLQSPPSRPRPPAPRDELPDRKGNAPVNAPAPAPALDAEEAIRGLRVIREVHDLVTIVPDGPVTGGARFDLSTEGGRESCKLWIAEKNRTANIYYHSQPLKGPPANGKATKEDVAFGEYAQADVDPSEDPSIPYEDRVEEVKRKIAALDPPPTITIWSGNGANVLWLLDQPEYDLKAFDEKNNRLNAALGCTGTFNVDRILKVPGTVAWSGKSKIRKGYPKAAQARLGEVRNGKSYSWDDLPSAEPKARQRASRRPSGAGSAGDPPPIPMPKESEIGPDELARLRDVLAAHPEVGEAIAGAGKGRSEQLASVAGACRNAGISPEDFGKLVAIHPKSAAHQHAIKDGNAPRALGRAWDLTGRRSARDAFRAPLTEGMLDAIAEAIANGSNDPLGVIVVPYEDCDDLDPPEGKLRTGDLEALRDFDTEGYERLAVALGARREARVELSRIVAESRKERLAQEEKVREAVEAEAEAVRAAAAQTFLPDYNRRAVPTRSAAALAYLDRRFFVLVIQGKLGVGAFEHDAILNRQRLVIYTPKDFALALDMPVMVGKDDKGNDIFKPASVVFLKRKGRPEFNGVGFFASEPCPKGVLNLWRGFAVEPKAGDWSLMQAHIRENICAGNDIHYQWVIAWLARGVQFPDKQGEVALVMKGPRGAGKGTLAHEYGALFAGHYLSVANPEYVRGRFNDHLRDAAVVFLDEAFFAGDKAHESILKALITEPVLLFEAKFQAAVMGRNITSVLMATNSSWAIPAGQDERRFMVLEVSDAHAQDTAYFGALRQQMVNGGRGAMLADLLALDLAAHLKLHDLDLRKPLVTAALIGQKLLSAPSHIRWWHGVLQSGVLNDPATMGLDPKTYQDMDAVWPEAVATARLLRLYQDSAEARRERRPATEEDIGELFGIGLGFGRLRSRRYPVPAPAGQQGVVRTPAQVRGYRLPPLDAARAALARLLKADALDWGYDDETDETEPSPTPDTNLPPFYQRNRPTEPG